MIIELESSEALLRIPSFVSFPSERMKRKSRTGVFLLLLLCALLLFVAVQWSCVSLSSPLFYSPSFNFVIQEIHKTRCVRREQGAVNPTAPIVQEKKIPMPTTIQPLVSAASRDVVWLGESASKNPTATASDTHSYLLVLFTTEEVSPPSLAHI